MSTKQLGASESATEVGKDGVRHPVFHHVNLKTARLGEMIDWYEVAVGMRVNFRDDVIAFMTNDDANHRVALTALPGTSDDPEKVPHSGMHHSAFEFASMEDLLGRYQSLKEDGIEPHACVDHGLTMSFYYLDPDGNSVELQSDNHGDWAASAEWMRTAAEFAANPIGELVDPDKLCDVSAGGMSAEEIHRRAYAGEYPPSGPVDLRLP
jgi:catechol 2,3-dioxygenase